MSIDIGVFDEAAGEKLDFTADYQARTPRILARFLAKFVDWYVSALLSIVMAFVAAFAYGRLALILGWRRDIFDGWGALLIGSLWVVIVFFIFEIFVLRQFGQTPGKALMGIRIHNGLGQRVPLKTHLKRSSAALFFGLGGMVPVVSLITMVYGSVVLRDKGAVSWDRYNGVYYETKPVGPVRWILAILIYATCRAGEIMLTTF